MNLPQHGQFIDIHTHGGNPAKDVYVVKNLMAHEDCFPGDVSETPFTCGIHPWNLNEDNFDTLLSRVSSVVTFPNMIGIGETGFDKLRGASSDLQNRAFTEQIAISESVNKPVIIHCVRAWDELLAAHKKLKPTMPWLIHGFRGSSELARQLIAKGFYLSFWFDFIIRSESVQLLKSLPVDRIFLETDGADIDIRDIYRKVAKDLDITVDELKLVIQANFGVFFWKPFR